MIRISGQTISPSNTCLYVMLGFVLTVFIVAIGAGFAESQEVLDHLNRFSFVAVTVFAGVFLMDFVTLFFFKPVRVERECALSVAVDRWTDVMLTIHHRYKTPTFVELFDDVSERAEFENLPARVKLIPQKKSSIAYRLKVKVRGEFKLGQCHIRRPSLFGLWKGGCRAGEQAVVKVYPDFSAITAFTILATDNHESQIGIKRKPRRGEGLDFMQLRDYRNGDPLRQIDWKATSRRHKLISKEYQDERDQQIVLLIDSGRRMRSKDDTLSHFDHSLNAMLLVSYIALRQGDSVSVMSFGNQQRWIAPQKGIGAMKTILNGMYDLQAGTHASDYVGAAETLYRLQRKRALVVLVTNSRDEEVEELLMASKLLKRQHVLLLANIREAVVDQLLEKDIQDFDDALTYTGAHHYLKRRKEVQQKIISNGVFTVDCLAKHLAVRVANSYLEIKRAGVL